MGTVKTKVGFSDKAQQEFAKTEEALKKVSENLIAEAKATNSYLILSDKDGNPIKVEAKDL